MECVVVFVTCKDNEEAKKISEKVLDEHLAACANIIDSIFSLFDWQGKRCSEKEAVLILKTRRDLFEALRHEVRSVHSYGVPEIIALPVVAGDEEYLNWIRAQTRITEVKEDAA